MVALRQIAAWLAAAIALLGTSEPLLAQSTAPHIDHILPAGGQRGKTVTIGVRGRHLTGASEIRVAGGGVSGKVLSVEQPDAGKKTEKRLDAAVNPDLAQIELSIDAAATVGERDLRVISPGGASNRMRFFIDDLNEVVEVEPNSKPEQAQALPPLPVVVNGQAFQADRDFFRFDAKAGQTLVFEAYAQRIRPYIADGVPGWFQATLTLYDNTGHELQFVDDFRHHPDPVMVYRVPRDGQYLIEIKDAMFRGRDDFVYRLRIGELPWVTHLFPLGGQRGTKVDVQLFGVNLPNDRPALELPADSPPQRWIQTTANGVSSTPLPFAVGDLPEILEKEPNDSVEKPQEVTWPAVVAGRIDAPGDIDHYRFHVEAKQQLVLEVFARRLDSPLDSLLTVYDAKGKQLAQNDDTKDETAGLITHHSDSYVLFTFPAAGDYVASVGDAQNKGGPECAYRLSLAPPRPDFVLRMRPDNARAPQGGSALLTVTAFRRDNFTGPIELTVDGLPGGFIAPPGEIAEKEKEARITITAPADAPQGLLVPRVTGKARIGEADVVHPAEPAEELLQAFYYTHNVPCQESALAIIAAGEFTLAIDMPPLGYFEVPVRGELKIPVKVRFKSDEKRSAPITLRPDVPPKGIKLQVPPIAVDQSETTVTITTIGNQISVGQSGVFILSATTRQGKDTISGFAPAIPFKIVRAP